MSWNAALETDLRHAEIHPSRMVLGRVWEEHIPPWCPNCEYDLRGLSGPACSECGYQPTFAELRDAAREAWENVLQLRQMNSQLRVGSRVLLAGFIVVVLLRLTDASAFGMIIGSLCGLIAMGLGMQVFRAKMLPAPAVERLPVEPQYKSGAAVGLLGAMLVVLSIAVALF